VPSQERVQWAKTRVAATAAAAVLILGTLILTMTGGTLFEPKAALYLYMPDAVALVADAPVRVDGITVGKVESVQLTGSRQPDRIVKVSMILERDRLVLIPADSTAQASADTIIGDKFVDIDSGKSSDRLRPGSYVTYKATPDLMKRLDVAQFKENIRQMDQLLTGIEQGNSEVGRLIQGDEIYQTARRKVAALQAGIRALHDTSTDIGQVVYTDTLYRKAEAQIRDVDQSLAKIQSGQGALGQFLHDDAQYAQLRDLAAQFRKMIRDVGASDFFQSDAQYTSWDKSLKQMIRSVDEFNANPMMVGTDTYENLTGMAKEIGEQMRDFRGNPKKYLRLKVF
jgi:phospholipid/cholesterol/gamma-HCH transport system substrate-binding protein